MWPRLGLDNTLKATIAPRSTVLFNPGQDTFTDAPIGTPLSDTPGWNDPQGGAPTDLTLATGGGVETGTAPTVGDVVINGPTPGTSDRIITGTIGDPTVAVGAIGVFAPDPANSLTVSYNPTGTKVDLIQTVGGTVTTVQQVTQAVVANDVLGAVVKGGYLWVTLNGQILGARQALHAAFTNQRPGLVVRNPLGLQALFLKRFAWAGINSGYGYSYGLNYGN